MSYNKNECQSHLFWFELHKKSINVYHCEMNYIMLMLIVDAKYCIKLSWFNIDQIKVPWYIADVCRKQVKRKWNFMKQKNKCIKFIIDLIIINEKYFIIILLNEVCFFSPEVLPQRFQLSKMIYFSEKTLRQLSFWELFQVSECASDQRLYSTFLPRFKVSLILSNYKGK